MLKLLSKDEREETIDKFRYRYEQVRYRAPETFGSVFGARVTTRFPRIAYWIAIAVGARNIKDDEIVYDVSYMDVLNRQFMKTKAFGQDV